MNQVTETSVRDAKDWLDAGTAIFVDVREDNELLQARIAGAVHVPLSRFDPADIPTVPEKRVVFVCAVGARSFQAADYLLNQEILTEAYNLTGGLQAWNIAGLPLESG